MKGCCVCHVLFAPRASAMSWFSSIKSCDFNYINTHLLVLSSQSWFFPTVAKFDQFVAPQTGTGIIFLVRINIPPAQSVATLLSDLCHQFLRHCTDRFSEEPNTSFSWWVKKKRYLNINSRIFLIRRNPHPLFLICTTLSKRQSKQVKRSFFQYSRIENEEDFKKAVEKIPDFKVKAEKVIIFAFSSFIFSSKAVKSMLFLNNSPYNNSVLNN